MKIVSFPHYTCGGLLCDILNDTFSDIDANGGIASQQHAIGKIEDSDSILEDFDFELLWQRLQEFSRDQWVGTHCWLGRADLSRFDQVINITTMTYRSRLYRWQRAHYHYYSQRPEWRSLKDLDLIDKQRETAKNYLIPFRPITGSVVVNLEFADVVECQPAFRNLLPPHSQKHLTRWQQVNHFLYDHCDPDAVNRFHEAEHEHQLRERYVYS